jgi:hypothetical protein
MPSPMTLICKINNNVRIKVLDVNCNLTMPSQEQCMKGQHVNFDGEGANNA